MPANTAAWLRNESGGLEVGPAPYTPPREHEIVLRNHAVAINPVDWKVEIVGGLIYPWLSYPAVLGSDVGTEKTRNTVAEGAF